jgi:hypothetical protein
LGAAEEDIRIMMFENAKAWFEGAKASISK